MAKPTKVASNESTAKEIAKAEEQSIGRPPQSGKLAKNSGAGSTSRKNPVVK